MRLAYYAGASTAAAAACLLKAFHERPNFYSATVYLSQSNACLLILTNLLLLCACTAMYLLQRLLYGPLRPIEIEQLSEKAWYAVLDTLLAMPSFREDVGGALLAMFVLLLAGKLWGWIGEGRVDVLEQQPPANPRLFHARLSTSLILSVVFDLAMLKFCLETLLDDPRPGMMVIFTFEFGILTIFSTFTFLRYCLSVWEAWTVQKQTAVAIEARKNEIRAERAATAASRQNEGGEAQSAPSPSEEEPIVVDEHEVDVPGWEEKRRWLFGLELVADFLKLCGYIVFFVISVTFNGLPMHIMRDVYMTFASFTKRVSDFIAYRKATSEMNTRYPDATTAEIREDTCIVCRENMVAWEQPNAGAQPQPAGEQPAPAPAAAPAPTPARQRDEGLRAKKLPCGHILHLRCLKAWLERQQVCPTCRRPVVTAAVPDAAAAAAGGGNGPPGQGGQPGQPAAPRANRNRMFNIGPLRVALLNGPNEQVRNIINQIQNQNNPGGGAVNNALPAANNQGADPPVAGQLPGGTALPPRRAAVPLNVQLLQVEQRIMQEFHNLGVQQQQFAILRNMEAELARLRAQVLPAQPAVGTNGAPRQGAAQVPNVTLQQPLHEQLTGPATEQYTSGHESLPEGLVLPEGWTVTPLRRIDAVQDPPAQATASSSRIPTSAPTGSGTTSVAPGVGLVGDDVPRDQNGSPLFVATSDTGATDGSASAASSTADENVPPQPLDAATSSAQPVPTPTIASSSQAIDNTAETGNIPSQLHNTTSVATHEPTATTSSSQIPGSAPAPETNTAPWSAGNDSWSFVDQPGSSSSHTPEPPAGSSSQEQGSKGKAPEVEEVPDAGT